MSCLWRREISLFAALLIVSVFFVGSARARGESFEISALNKVENLDLSGNIVHAVNFGDTGNITVGGILFSREIEIPSITRVAQGQGLSSWFGLPPGTGDASLNKLLDGLIYSTNSTLPSVISININNMSVDSSYLLQLLFYEPEGHDRSFDINVENEMITTNFSPLAAQGGISGQGGSLIKYEFAASDPTLNIKIKSRYSACGICGLILTDNTASFFTDYGSGTTTELRAGKGTWKINWGQDAWTWSEGEADPLLDVNVSSILDIHTTAPADMSAELVATMPIAGSLTLSAHDPQNVDNIIGTMVLSGTGKNVVDLNASRAIVDEGSGMAMTHFPAPEPRMTLTLNSADGIFAPIEQEGDWELLLAGMYAAPLIEGMALQDNIFAALGGQAPVIGGMGTFALSGDYTEYPARRAESFCAFGTAYTTSMSGSGGIWEQVWNKEANDWFTCQVSGDRNFLGKDVVGRLETHATAPPTIDADFMLHLPLGGTLTLTDYDDVNPRRVNGRIIADIETVFVADLNAERALIDPNGNVVIAFGAAVQNPAVPTKITVKETTGIYADVKQIGTWNFYVSGTITAAVIPDIPLQQSILAALQNSELLLGAKEDVVLTGWYSHAAD